MSEISHFEGFHAEGDVAPIRDHLINRRRRLRAIAERTPTAERSSTAELVRLLGEVDSALERLAGGSYGYCERCDDTVENDRLLADPMVRVCLGCLDEAESRALERDLELAASIQAALLPSRRLRHSGWEVAYRYMPLGPVSGDHADVLLPREVGAPLHAVLGDVSGKGVAAALLMSHLQAALRALSGMPLPLEAMIARANHLLCESTAANAYATLVVARLDADGAVELVNAGHCPPVLALRDATTPVPATGLPLGLMAEAEFRSRRFVLEPGETLVLYTDGLSESHDAAGAELGAAAVIRLIGTLRDRDLDELLDRCLERASNLRGSSPRTDDLTMMAIRRVG